jgi:plastocyanin
MNTDDLTGLVVFSDVDKTQWYAIYLAAALDLKIVQGYPDGTFKPTQTVNLVENLKMLMNAREVDLTKIVVTFDPYIDAPKTEWYAKFVQYGKMANLLEADAGGNIYPAQGMTRAKLAEVAYRLIYMQENGLDMYPPQNTPTEEDKNANDDLVADTPEQILLKVNLTGSVFKPASMTVGQGSKVAWINAESYTCTIKSTSGSEISSGALSNGDTYSHVFNTLGTFNYSCVEKPAVKGTIIVKPAIEVPTI